MAHECSNIGIHMEVMGCPTTCQHCWVLGQPYQAMPLSDVRWALEEIRQFCDAHHLTVDGFPMHKVAAHPEAAQVMKLFHDVWGWWNSLFQRLGFH
jgi:hypothetical protein